MLGSYKSNESAGSSGTSALAEIREGAERLAMELDEYLSKSSNTKASIFRVDGVSSTPIEAVADLQLATARKLREVCFSFFNTDSNCLVVFWQFVLIQPDLSVFVGYATLLPYLLV